MALDELPLDILREVIEFSAASSRHQAAVLSQISHAINEWVRPYLIQTLIYYEEGSWPPVPSLSWFETNGRHVHRMLWGLDVSQLVPILANCPHIQDLAIWVSVTSTNITILLPIFATLKLQRISIDLQSLFSNTPFQREQGKHPMFQHITHLDVVQSFYEWSQIEGVAELPCLTHLSVPRRSDYMNTVLKILEQCAQLKIMILISSSFKRYQKNSNNAAEEQALSDDCTDHRVVALSVEPIGDWERGALGGNDMWIFAEGIVAQRLERELQQISNSGESGL